MLPYLAGLRKVAVTRLFFLPEADRTKNQRSENVGFPDGRTITITDITLAMKRLPGLLANK